MWLDTTNGDSTSILNERGAALVNAEEKYKNYFAYSENIKGDAIYETTYNGTNFYAWDSLKVSSYFSPGSCFLVRGSLSANGYQEGVFYWNSSNGDIYWVETFRAAFAF